MPSELLLSAQQRDEVLRLYDAQGPLAAIAYVRRTTGADLAEANGAVQALARETGRIREPAETGLSARIIAVGPFRRELIPFLAYTDPAYYAATREGVPVVVNFVDVYRDSKEVYALAACFGADPWDFNTHELNPWRTDLDALRTLLADEEDGYYVSKLEALRAAGFQFYFHLDEGDE